MIGAFAQQIQSGRGLRTSQGFHVSLRFALASRDYAILHKERLKLE